MDTKETSNYRDVKQHTRCPMIATNGETTQIIDSELVARQISN